MREGEIKTVIFQLLAKIAPDEDSETLEMNSNIRDTLGIDSFDFLQFIIGLDEELGIKTPEEDYGKMTTLEALITYIKSVEQQQSK
ncbi:acyl carrier protein [Maribacter halichondriae]|uniref:acyl carrier protein n=1 Tax=Maribacter halichondriae TaxID=2980554 RepID=UPI002358A739|nr:phosphopantetheine-binding protein [Maribacter sp. Hal144]